MEKLKFDDGKGDGINETFKRFFQRLNMNTCRHTTQTMNQI